MIVDRSECPIHLACDHFSFSRYFHRQCWQQFLACAAGAANLVLHSSGCLPTHRNTLPHPESIPLLKIGRKSPRNITEIGLRLLRLSAFRYCRDSSVSFLAHLNSTTMVEGLSCNILSLILIMT